MRFGISTLMIVVFVASVICAVAMHGSFLAFGLGFMALMVVLLQLMGRRGEPPAIIRETSTEAEAYMVRDFLAEHGITALVELNRAYQMMGGLHSARVLVPPGQEQQARLLLAELTKGEAQSSATTSNADSQDPAYDHDADAR